MYADEQTLELSQVRLEIRESLRFTQRQSGDVPWYLVEDEATGKFFQIGLPQYTFLSLLNGKRNVHEALMHTASVLPEHAIDEQEAASLCKWAIDSDLVRTEFSDSLYHRDKKRFAELKQQSFALLNPITVKIPLLKPDAWFTKLNRWFGWLISPWGALIWLSVVLTGFFQLLLNWERFVAHRASSISSADLLWFTIAWLALKLIHETGHGLTCKKFGGSVQSAGILLLLMIPLPFVDVTSSWRFNNRWHRILTAAAGMIAEIFVAGIASYVWSVSDPGPLQFHAGNLVIAATVHTLLFNANPLMKFDSYYIMSDLVGIPNLYTHGRSYVKSFFKFLYFGSRIKPLGEMGVRATFTKFYGFATIGWFMIISVSLMLGALALFEGIGLLLTVLGVLLWFGLPAFKLIKFIVAGGETERPNLKWFAVAATITAVAMAAFFGLCPSPSVVTAPLVVDYQPVMVVRSKSTGFLKEILVKDRDLVDQGQVLARLSNPDLENELDSLEIDIEISKLRINSLLSIGDVAGLKLERESLIAATKRSAELERQIEELSIKAISSGIILDRNLKNEQGIWLSEGDEFCSVGTGSELAAQVLVPVTEIGWIKKHHSRDVDLLIWGESELVAATIDRIHPRARRELPHQAFAANNGGPLPVVSSREVEGVDAGNDEMILVDPRVLMDLEFRDPARNIQAGQSGMMIFRGRDQKMGGYLVSKIGRFLRRNTLRTHGL